LPLIMLSEQTIPNGFTELQSTEMFLKQLLNQVLVKLSMEYEQM